MDAPEVLVRLALVVALGGAGDTDLRLVQKDAMTDPDFPAILTEIENKLKDRFSDYLVVVTDHEKVYALNSSNTTALGLGLYAHLKAKQELLREFDD